MKAIYYEKYGQPEDLQLVEVTKPAPKHNEVLVKVHAASINYVDWQVLRGESLMLRMMNGLFKPKKNIPGDDLAGTVESIGTEVKLFKPGDEVFGFSDCGAFAEFCSTTEDTLALKPAQVSFEAAAVVPTAGLTALQGLRDKGQIKPGHKVLIVGASGGVGTYAVQIAKHFGAEVTGLCSTEKMDLVHSIGADKIIDYTKQDFTKNGQLYDLIFSVGGSYSILAYERALNPGGKYICAGGSATQYFQALLLGPIIAAKGRKKITSMYSDVNEEDLEFLVELIETGKISPVIDKRYSLNRVPEALSYYGDGNVQGKIVITMDNM